MKDIKQNNKRHKQLISNEREIKTIGQVEYHKRGIGWSSKKKDDISQPR